MSPPTDIFRGPGPVGPQRMAPGSDRPPAEPPPGVRAELLWRVAARLGRDHPARDTDGAAPTCGSCRQAWPCSGRRLAELGMVTATVRPAAG